MKTLQLLLHVVSSYLLLSEVADARSHDQIDSLLSDQNDGELSSRNLYKSEWKCPFPFGFYADPDDCEYFQMCAMGKSKRVKCKMGMRFCIVRRTCLPGFMAVCGYKDKITEEPTSIEIEATTPKDEDFACPNFMGSFPHSRDCSKYYSCMMYRFSLKTCPETQLFDAVKSSCKPADQVNCGTRPRPGSTTPDIVVTETSTAIVTETSTDTETNPDIVTETNTNPDIVTETNTNPDIVTETKTNPDIVTETNPDSTETETDAITTTISPTEDTTDTPTTPVITTTEDFPTGPPDTDCDEEDVDCIIDETGDITEWFKCPEDIGSYVHPSSDKLFIFCMNWIPLVKKCGMDMMFSKDVSTCVYIDSSEEKVYSSEEKV